MLAKRIIPCLDVTGGRVVKGVGFVNLQDAGDPVEIARRYEQEGADEICFLDITASSDSRPIMIDLVRRTAEELFMPLTVGGGVRSTDDIRDLLAAGADKVSLNTAAIENPDLVRTASRMFGTSTIVVAIDARRSNSANEHSGQTASVGRRESNNVFNVTATSGSGLFAPPDGGGTPPQAVSSFGNDAFLATRHNVAGPLAAPLRGWYVYSHGGRRPTGLDVVAWAKQVEEAGAGEILLTSMDCDGTYEGYDLALTRAVTEAVHIPVIASGGAGTLEHLFEAFDQGGADAVLAASIFHYRKYTLSEAKAYLAQKGIPVRIV